MPRLIADHVEGTLSLGDFIAAVEAADFDPRDEESFAALGPLLGRLGNDRAFLGDFALAELKARCAGQVAANHYGAQVILLHRASERWFLRANFWPAAHDGVVKRSGTAPFFYDVPHDHNFSFLTVGYLGPGYWSDYYEYDYDAVTGLPDEPAGLRFVERSRLDRGKVMLYRAHRDVHRQLPADALSVSVNLMETSRFQPWLDQYRFDLERGVVASVLGQSPAQALLALAIPLGGDDGRDLAEDFAANHPSGRMRFAAIKALAGAAGERAARAAVIERGARASDPWVAGMCARELARMETGADWIANAPPGDYPDSEQSAAAA